MLLLDWNGCDDQHVILKHWSVDTHDLLLQARSQPAIELAVVQPQLSIVKASSNPMLSLSEI